MRSAATIFRCFHAARRANVLRVTGRQDFGQSVAESAAHAASKGSAALPASPSGKFSESHRESSSSRDTTLVPRGRPAAPRGPPRGARGPEGARGPRGGGPRGARGPGAGRAAPRAGGRPLADIKSSARVECRAGLRRLYERERWTHDLIRSVSAIFAYNATFNAAKSFFQSKSRSSHKRDFLS